MIDRRDRRDSEPLSDSNDGRIHHIESQVSVAIAQLDTAQPIGSGEIYRCQFAACDETQELVMRLYTEAIQDQPGRLGDHRHR